MTNQSSTKNQPVKGQAQIGDKVAYTDMANPRTVYTVIDTIHEGQYGLLNEETNGYEASDLRQIGWTFAE